MKIIPHELPLLPAQFFFVDEIYFFFCQLFNQGLVKAIEFLLLLQHNLLNFFKKRFRICARSVAVCEMITSGCSICRRLSMFLVSKRSTKLRLAAMITA